MSQEHTKTQNPALFAHIIASDLDGTLLNGEHHVSPITRQVLHDIGSRYNVDGLNKVILIMASGRPVFDVSAILGELQLEKSMLGYIVSSNGAQVHQCVYDLDGNCNLKALRDTPIKPNLVKELFLLLPPDENEININLYQNDKWRCTLDWDDQLQYYKVSQIKYELIPREKELEMYEGFSTSSGHCDAQNPFENVYKLYYGSDNTERIEQLERVIGEKFGGDLCVTYSSPYSLEITSSGITKAASIQFLLHTLQSATDGPRLHCSGRKWTLGEDGVAFGDGLNDVEMLQAAKMSFVMGNAPQNVKDVMMRSGRPAEVIKSNKEDGVAIKLRELFL